MYTGEAEGKHKQELLALKVINTVLTHWRTDMHGNLESREQETVQEHKELNN